MLQFRHTPLSLMDDPLNDMLSYTKDHPPLSLMDDPLNDMLSYTKDHPWRYTLPIEISNNGSPLSDFQLKFILYNTNGESLGDTLYLGSNVQSDFRDVRFSYHSPLSPFPQWFESIASTSATLWVKIPYIPTGQSMIYLYYGNPSANSLSNGDDTFIFFDDFPGTSLNSEKWTIVSSTGISVADSQFKVSYTSGSSTNGTIRSIPALGPNVALRIRLQTRTYYTNAGFGAADHSGTGSSIGWVYRTDYESAMYTGESYNNLWRPPRTISVSATAGDIITDPPSGWFIDEFAVPASAPLQWRRNDGSWTLSTRYNGITTAQPLELSHRRSHGPMACDWVIIRKYTAIEPIITPRSVITL